MGTNNAAAVDETRATISRLQHELDELKRARGWEFPEPVAPDQTAETVDAIVEALGDAGAVEFAEAFEFDPTPRGKGAPGRRAGLLSEPPENRNEPREPLPQSVLEQKGKGDIAIDHPRLGIMGNAVTLRDAVLGWWPRLRRLCSRPSCFAVLLVHVAPP